MAIWTPELRKRIMTALVGGALFLSLIIFGGSLGCFVLMTTISLGMVYEFSAISFCLPDQSEKKWVMLTLGWLLALTSYVFPLMEMHLVVVGLVLLFFYFLITANRYHTDEFQVHFRELILSVFGLVYLVFLPTYFIKLRTGTAGVHWTLIFLAVVWAGDTAAYFVGLKFGKNRLYPVISPKKTWEGAVGGLAGGFLAASLYKLLFFMEISWLAVVVISITVGIVAQVGDLCESFFKRAFVAKDSGSILPGHGGLLDRFDGIIYSAPVMFACIRVLG